MSIEPSVSSPPERPVNVSQAETPPAARQPSPADLLRRADNHLQRGNLQQAIVDSTKALEGNPELGDAYGVRGLAHRELGHIAEAVADCEQALRRGCQMPEVYFTRAVHREMQGDPRKALPDYDAVLRYDPTHAKALNGRGLLQFILGKKEPALADLNQAVELRPDWFMPYWNRGQLHHQQRDYPGAIGNYSKALELLRAEVYKEGALANNYPPETITLTDILCARATACYDNGQDEEGKKDFDEAVKRDPAKAHAARGQMWLKRSDYRRAVIDFGRVLRVHRKDVDGYIRRGMAFEGLKDLGHAVVDYTLAIKLAPDRVLPYSKRGGIFYRLGKNEQALADFDRWLELTPNDPRGYVARAGVHVRRRTFDLALTDLERAVRLDATNLAGVNGLAWLLATCPEDRFRNGKRAVMLATKACELTQRKAWFCLSSMAAAYAEVGEFPKAVQTQQDALRLTPEPEKKHAQARLALYESGQPFRE